jgi:hypothetical protein
MNLRLQVCFGKHISRQDHILNISICFRYMNRYAMPFTVSSPQHLDQMIREGAFHRRKAAEHSSSSGSKVKNIWG